MNNQLEEGETLWGNLLPLPKREQQKTLSLLGDTQQKNPCIALYGPGPSGVQCKCCVHLRYPLYRARRHWKCDLRQLSHGRSTDHRVNWPACGRYEERQGAYTGG